MGRILAGHPMAAEPIFTTEFGTPWDTGDTRALARRMAACLGIPTEDVGAKAFRIGGATDLQRRLGEERAERLLRQRGRWASDVAQAYARALLEDHLEASASVGGEVGRELEAVCEGWAQPAHFR